MEKMNSIEQYNEIINKENVILMFSADWCGDCRVIEPILPELEAENSQYKFYHIDRDEFIDLCGQLNVFGIPSFVAFNNGEEIGRFVSRDRKTKEEIQNFINTLNA